MHARIVSILIVLSGLLAPAAAAADAGVSSNWAGYAVHGAGFRSVSATWRQPGVSCARGHDSYSAYWVGLGGYSGSALEQIGTEADCHGDGRAALSAWYEMVPAASVPVPIALSAGDTLSASVRVSGHHATLVLRDLTTHRSFHATVGSRYIDVTSAEWIVEAPSDCVTSCLTLPLANFGSAVFSGARAESLGGHVGAIADPDWSDTAIRLVPGGARLASAHTALHSSGAAAPSSLTADGSSFQVSYSRVLLPGSFSLRRPAEIRAEHLLAPAAGAR